MFRLIFRLVEVAEVVKTVIVTVAIEEKESSIIHQLAKHIIPTS